MTAAAKLIAAVLLLLGVVVNGQIIVADNYNVTGNGTGFALNAGVNSGINPPTTRLTGSAAANLRYILTATTKTNTAFSIAFNKLKVTSAASPGRFSLSANGTTAFDFASVLGSTAANPTNPVVYDLAISMANKSAGTQRFSFALATAEGDASSWDFGLQVYRTDETDNFYTIGKRIDIGSSGLAADLNTWITNTAVGTWGTEIDLLVRVTDAGAETTTFNSRVQLSLDGGFTWVYDSRTDSDLPNGFRFNAAGRFILWDIAPDAGDVTYDNFSVSKVPLSGALISPANNVTNSGATESLKIVASNSAPGNVTVTFFGHEAAKPGPGPDFLITALPDTQNYAREDSALGSAAKEMWFAQTEWIITNRVRQNIAYVCHLGDCVQNGDILSGSPNSTEWRNATNAMYRLENPSRTLLPDGIPYGVSVGNHDQEPNGDPDGTTTLYTQYFGDDHFSDKSYYGGHFSTNNDSFFDLFSAGGMDFIVFSFEYGRYGSAILDWANAVLATNQNRRVIVETHHAGDDTPDDTTVAPFSNQGAAIYGALKSNPNFFLMLGGHVFNEGGEGRRSDTYNGHTVHTLISDYQGRFNGGNGLMRLMYFSPSNNMVSVKTFSPYTGQYETDANSEFSFTYNMQPNGVGSPGTAYVALGTNFNVTPGVQNTFTWSGLQPSKTYEWYFTVRDSLGNTWISPAQKFTASTNAAPVATNRTVTVVGDGPSQITLMATDPDGDSLTFITNSRPVRGLITNFDPVTGVLTYLPARGYRGVDQLTFQAFDSAAYSSVRTLTINVTAPPDANGNGIADSWEGLYGVTNVAADTDGDGQSNLAEYLANTNPTNAASRLSLLGAVRQDNGFINVMWSSVGGTRYRVQYANGSTNAFLDVLRSIDKEMDPSPIGTPSTQSFLDDFTLTGAPTNSVRFYRVRVAP